MCLFFSSCVYLFISLPRRSSQCQCLTMRCDSALNPKLNDPLCHRNIKETKILSFWGTSSYTNLVTVIRAWNPEDGMQFTVGDASIKHTSLGLFRVILPVLITLSLYCPPHLCVSCLLVTTTVLAMLLLCTTTQSPWTSVSATVTRWGLILSLRKELKLYLKEMYMLCLDRY